MISPVHSNSASAGEHENDWFTDGVNPLQKLLLWRRQPDAGPDGAEVALAGSVRGEARRRKGEQERLYDRPRGPVREVATCWRHTLAGRRQPGPCGTGGVRTRPAAIRYGGWTGR